MNGGSDIGRWALEDDQLEALLSGVSPSTAGLLGNPVAEFFADATMARGVALPNPSPSLQRLFVSGVPFEVPGAAVVDPAVATIGEEPVLDLSQQPFDEAQTFDAAQTFDGDQAFDAAQVFNGSEDLNQAASILGGPPLDPLDARAVPVDQTEALPFRRSLAEFAEAEPKRRRVYRSSPIEAALAILKPTGTKLLMGAAMLVVSAVAVEALGLYDFPLLSTGSREAGTIDIAANGGGGLEDQARLPTTSDQGGSSGGGGLLGPAASTDDDELGVSRPSSTDLAPARSTTSPATTITTSVSTTDAETTTAATDATTTTLNETSSTETVATETTAVSTSVAVTEPSVTTITVSSTLDTTSTTLAVVINPGAVLFVPESIPAGTYGAVVPQDGNRCTVRIFSGTGGDKTVNRAPGSFVSFTLVDGDAVLTGDGCPNVFTVS